MPTIHRSHLLTAVVCAVLAILLFAPIASSAATPAVIISQVYGGGGNSGSTWKNDFIELFNPGAAPVSVTGWSVQYASSAGTTWQKTNLTGTVPAGGYFLIQEAAGAGGTTPLPTADTIGTIAMSATGAKVALVNNQTALTGACPSGVVDFVGYDGANCPAPTPALTNTTAALRLADACAYTGTNSVDFAVGTPTPRNSASPGTVCSSGTATPTSVIRNQATVVAVSPAAGHAANSMTAGLGTIGGTGTQALFDDGTNGDANPGDGIFSGTLVVGQCTASGVRIIPVSIAYADGTHGAAAVLVSVATLNSVVNIYDIQGSGPRSPYECQPVTTSGVVTGRISNGFFLQDPVGDGDPSTSDGVFVFTSSAPSANAAVGNIVSVTGTVSEFVPSSDTNSPPVTEISGSPTVTLVSTGNPLPAPVEITSIDPNGSFDQLERYEGMRVHVASLTVTGPTLGNIDEPSATSTSTGLFFGVLAGTPRPFREPGVETFVPVPNPPCCVPRFDTNPERLRVDTSRLSSTLEVTDGVIVNNITGPLDFGYRMYSIVAEPGIEAATPNASALAAPAPDASEFTIANSNLRHFYDTIAGPAQDSTLTPDAYAKRLNKVSLAVRTLLHTPDILGVEEMENLATLQDLAGKINADAVSAGQPSPNYSAYLYDGNDISGINVGLLVKPNINVLSVTQYGKTDFIPGTTSIMNDRPPILLSATVTNQAETMPFYVIVNHLRSLSGLEDPANIARSKRRAQAEFLANLIQNIQAGDAGANIVSIGDYNSYEFNDGWVDVMGTITGAPAPPDQVVLASPDLVDPNLTDLLFSLPADQRYSYTYDGNAQALDHILVNQNMLGQVSRFAYARNNADFPESFGNDGNRPEKYADHDMPVAYFKLPTDHTPPVLTLPGDITQEGTSPAGAVVTFTATANDSWDGPTAVVCAPASGSTFPLGTTEVDCSSTDAHSNTATGKFHVNVVDTTAPIVAVTGVSNGATYIVGGVPVAGCSTTDGVSGVAANATLTVTGGTANHVGSFTATCSGGRDNAGNVAAPVSATYNVNYAFGGFSLGGRPVVNGGSTVPVKFQLRNASGALITTTTSVLAIEASSNPACSGVGGTPFPAAATGGTTLRFAGDGFIFNWKTEKSWTGCYNFLVLLDDATTQAALVTMK